jgi:integrase
LDDWVWTISRDRTKNGRTHQIDLSPAAAKLIPAEKISARRFVFSTTGYSAPSGFSKAKAKLDKQMASILGECFQPWRTHDLRRTAASGMAALGFQPSVIERVLNHVSGAQGGLIGVYQRYEYREERRTATQAWADRVIKLVSSS